MIASTAQVRTRLRWVKRLRALSTVAPSMARGNAKFFSVALAPGRALSAGDQRAPRDVKVGAVWTPLRAKTRTSAGTTLSRLAQNCRLQLFNLPVSPAALSLTRSFQVPLATSEDALTVKVCTMLSALPPLRLCST